MEKEYYVNIAVSGRMRVKVKALTPDDAENKANETVSDADFGPLSDIDWETKSIEDKHGNPIDAQ